MKIKQLCSRLGWGALVFLLAAMSTLAQNPPGGYGPSSGGSSSGSITSVSSLPATCTPGVTAPVNLLTGPYPGLYQCGPVANQWTGFGNFHSGFQGLAPQDFGAKGDGHQAGDGVLTSGSAVITSATFGFCDGGATVCAAGRTSDVGKVFEGACNPSSFKGTVLSVQSATQITLSATQSTCNGGGFRIGTWTDDTTALQSWVTAGLAAGFQAHNFYIPRGNYYTTKPLHFTNPNSALECGAVSNGNTGFINCSIQIIGAGSTDAIIHPATGANFLWTSGGATDNALMTVNGFSFGTVTGFALVSDGATYTTGLSGHAAGLMMGSTNITGGGVQHFITSQVWVQQFVGDASMAGLYDPGCFECTFFNMAIEGNSTNAFLSPAEKELYDTLFFEGQQVAAGTVNNVSIFGTNLKQVRFHNIHFQDTASDIAALEFLTGTTIQAGETLVLDEIRVTGGSATDLGILFDSGCAGNIDIDSSSLINTFNAAGENAIWNRSGSTCNVSVNGGSIAAGASGNAVKNDAAGGQVYLQGVAAITGLISGTHPERTFGLIQTATGWGGNGGITGTYFLSDQAAACTNGEIALSAGWQSTGSATVTAVAGKGQTCSWTITTGTTTAANPTVTDTFVAALPDATTVCELNIHGGTHTAAAGEGFNQTTISATAPVFTANFTPTAGGTTYLVTRRCGP